MIFRMQRPAVVRDVLWNLVWNQAAAAGFRRGEVPGDLIHYADLLPLSAYFDSDERLPRFHLTMPDPRALSTARDWGLTDDAPETHAVRRALTARVYTLCPVPDAEWQRRVRVDVLEPLAGEWRTALGRVQEALASPPSHYHIVPNFALLSDDLEGLVGLGSIEVRPAHLLRKNVQTPDPVVMHYLERPLLAWPERWDLDAGATVLGPSPDGPAPEIRLSGKQRWDAIAP
jgi:hypothetical protein